jgi:hypothetical protein
VNALLTAALRLIDPGETAALAEVHTGRHAALYSIGRLDEADEEYGTIARLCTTALQRADATCVQVSSLTHRNRSAEAIGLGLDSLRELGITVPAADRLRVELDHQFDFLDRWLDRTEAADDLARPDITDPRSAREAGQAVVRGYRADPRRPWLGLEALRIWLEHGPGRTLLALAKPPPLGRCRRLRRRVPGDATDRGAGRGLRLRARNLAGAVRLLACWFERSKRCPRG